MSYINAVDPASPVKSTTFANLQWYLAMSLFLAVDGHLLLLQALGASFAVVPAGAASPDALWRAIAPASVQVFALGMTLAAPAIVVLLLTDLMIGLVGRIMPQAPVLMVGMALKPLAGLVALSLAYAALPRALRAGLDRTLLDLGRLAQAAVS
jgi:flagellar biosynthetic protein FliR